MRVCLVEKNQEAVWTLFLTRKHSPEEGGALTGGCCTVTWDPLWLNDRLIDSHAWKDDIPAISLAGGGGTNTSCLFVSVLIFGWLRGESQSWMKWEFPVFSLKENEVHAYICLLFSKCDYFFKIAGSESQWNRKEASEPPVKYLRCIFLSFFSKSQGNVPREDCVSDLNCDLTLVLKTTKYHIR